MLNMKTLRAWYRRRYSPRPPATYMPSYMYWHTAMCLGGVPFEQAVQEEREWAESATRRWLAGEKMGRR